MADATGRFCRSVELCDDYMRGYYGLKMVRQKTLQPDLRLQSITRVQQ